MNGLVLTAYMLFPFGIYGLFVFMKDILAPKIKMKQGFVRCIQLMTNGKFKTFWAKPEIITTENEETKIILRKGDEIYDYIDSPEYYVIDKGIKTVYYDAEKNLVSIAKAHKIKSEYSSAVTEGILMRTWNLAKAVAFKEKMRTDILFMLIAAGAAVISVLLILGMMNRIDQLVNQVGSLKSTIADLKTLLASAPKPS